MGNPKKKSFGKPFQPGKSGNPSGLPSAHRAASVEAVKSALSAVDPKLGKTALERIIAHSIRRALQGSYKDKKLLLNYGLGMPKQTMDLDVFNYTDSLAAIQKRRAAGSGNGHVDAQEHEVAPSLPDEQEEATQPAIEARPLSERVIVKQERW